MFLKEKKILNWNLALIALALLMLFPLYLSINAAVYYSDSSNTNNNEGLLVIGYATIYSIFIWFPYLLILFLSRRETNLNAKLISIIPFVAMFVLAIFATINGLSW